MTDSPVEYMYLRNDIFDVTSGKFFHPLHIIGFLYAYMILEIFEIASTALDALLHMMLLSICCAIRFPSDLGIVI